MGPIHRLAADVGFGPAELGVEAGIIVGGTTENLTGGVLGSGQAAPVAADAALPFGDTTNGGDVTQVDPALHLDDHGVA